MTCRLGITIISVILNPINRGEMVVGAQRRRLCLKPLSGRNTKRHAEVSFMRVIGYISKHGLVLSLFAIERGIWPLRSG